MLVAYRQLREESLVENLQQKMGAGERHYPPFPRNVLFFDCHALDGDRFFWHILMVAEVTCCNFSDFIDHIHSLSDLGENCVAVAVGGRGFVVEKVVVNQIDEKLAGCTIDHLGAGHS